MSDRTNPPIPMVVGGRYELIAERNGMQAGTALRCWGADSRQSLGEFGLARASTKKMRQAIWYFDWKDVRYVG